MKILSVNCGSSSLKFQMFTMPEETVLISGVFERIGINGGKYAIKVNGEKIARDIEMADHKIAFELLVKELLDNKVVESLDEIKGIGHRVVQGGDFFKDSVVIGDVELAKIDELSALAPLHNPAAIIGINAAREVISGAVNTAVFDTSFHQTMPEENFIYALPYSWYEKFKVRRYGMHGTSHKYVSIRMNEILNKENTKIITCHVGNGGSVSAVVNGKCINTSMGLTPNAGLVMGSRCGDIDASILPYIMDQTGMSTKDIDNAINKESGLLGISGVSSDARDIEDGIKEGNQRCVLANTIYMKRIVDYIAKYYVEMGGADAIVFTAGVGENGIDARSEVVNRLGALGVILDDEANNCRGKEVCITTQESKIPVYVIPTDEEVMIARDTFNLIK